MAKSNQLAVKEEAALPAEYNYGEFADLGFENAGSEDYSIPFIGVLQSNSPICAVEESGARPGMLINTVTGELIKGSEGVVFVPVITVHNYVEWRPREKGGGVVGVHDLNSELVGLARREQRVGKFITADENELIETFSVYGVVVNEDGTTSQAVIAFTSTKIKKYKKWMTQARTIQIPVGDGRRIKAPLPSHRYRVRTTKEKNTKGEFFNFDVTFDGANATEARLTSDDPIFLEAVAFNEAVKAGLVKVDHEGNAKAGGADTGGDGDSEKEIPF